MGKNKINNPANHNYNLNSLWQSPGENWLHRFLGMKCAPVVFSLGLADGYETLVSGDRLGEGIKDVSEGVGDRIGEGKLERD